MSLLQRSAQIVRITYLRVRRAIRTISVDAVIDGIFHYLEAVFVIAATTFLISIYNPALADWVGLGLMVLLGMRFGPKLTQCLLKSDRSFTAYMLGVAVGMAPIVILAPLMAIIQATIEVDVERAKEKLEELDRREKMLVCARQGIPDNRCPGYEPQ